ncbi:MAG: sigma-70 family RNA polymerase sigma factor [Bacteroidota bacterium]
MKPDCARVAPIYLEYKQHLLRFILSKVRDPEIAEEILSQVMLKVYDNCHKLEELQNPKAWMVTIARNAVVDHFRAASKVAAIISTDDDMISDTSSLDRSLAECVEPMIRRLPQKYSEPLIQHELLGIPQKQLAVEFGMSESGMKSRIQRGRKMLKEEFLACCHIEVGENGIEEIVPRKRGC